MTKTISIIVPIYNVEKYLARCLDSIIGQTFRDIEIILVNDGSKDKSLEICCEYSQRDNRIKVINKVNQGVSMARNTGIEAAKGEFIGFVDPDDWIEPEMYSSMYSKIKETKCNMAFCNYSKDDKFISSAKLFKFEKNVLGKMEIIDELIGNMVGIEDILPKYVYVMGCVWRSLYRKSFIDKFNLRFKQGITIMEDLIFTVEALIYCDKVCIDHGVWYHYVQNKSSALHAYNQKMWQDQINVHNILEKLLEEAELDDYMRNRLDLRYIGMVLSAMNNEMKDSNSTVKDKMETVRRMSNDAKLKVCMERAAKYNIENVKNLKHKEELSVLLKELSD